jgi:Tfp pilus assembly protein PilX
MNATTHKPKSRATEAGYVLIIVLLLIIMFTGLGVLAMRHTRQELRSAGAYLDATQAADLVRGALALVATDLRTSSDYYEYKFLETEGSDGGVDDVETYNIPLNDGMFKNSACTVSEHDGCIRYLSTLDDTGSLYGDDPENLKSLYGTSVETYVTQQAPGVGPCPPGFSCFDDQN